MGSIELLKRKREGIRSRVTRFQLFVKRFDPEKPDQDEELDLRLAKMEETLSEFESVQAEIELLTEDVDLEELEREDFEDVYFKVLSEGRAKAGGGRAERRKAREGIVEVEIEADPPGGGQIPQFGGNYDEWSGFAEIFESLVDRNDQLTEREKLDCLKCCLSEGSLELMGKLESSGGRGYRSAWRRLKESFDNRRSIVDRHLDRIFKLPHLRNDSPEGFRCTLDGLAEHLEALRQLDEPVQYWDTLIVYLVASKFDRATGAAWEASLGRRERPTVERLFAFLRRSCQTLEIVRNNRCLDASPRPSDALCPTSSTSPFRNKIKCYLCYEFHSIHKCEHFIKLTVQERFQRVRTLRLCFNCLRSKGHTAEYCRLNRCKFCLMKHNYLLHRPRLINSWPGQHPPRAPLHSLTKTQILPTALYLIADSYNKFQIATTLLDNASHSSLPSRRYQAKYKTDNNNPTPLGRYSSRYSRSPTASSAPEV